MLKKLLMTAALLHAACAFAAINANIDANSASTTELDAIKGIGPELASRIIIQRSKASFTDWNDLVQRVHGVGNASAAKFSTHGLTVNGKPYPGAPTRPAATPQASPAPR